MLTVKTNVFYLTIKSFKQNNTQIHELVREGCHSLYPLNNPEIVCQCRRKEWDKSRATRMIIQSVSKEQLQKWCTQMVYAPVSVFLIEYASIQWFSTIFLYQGNYLLCLL